MDLNLNAKIVKIQPRRSCLSAIELLAQRGANSRVNQHNASTSTSTSLSIGQSYSAEEDKTLECLNASLRKQLSALRIDSLEGGSLAIWDVNKNMAHVVRKDGKYDTFGVTIGRELYLEYYETLYLVEMGRMRLQYNERLLSIEEIYLLLLGEHASKKFCEYLVYAHLTRAGFILIRHKNKHFHQEFLNSNEEPTETDCTWAWLCEAVQNLPVPFQIKQTEIYANVKRKIESIKSTIIGQQMLVEKSKGNANPANLNAECTENEEPPRSSLDKQKQIESPQTPASSSKRNEEPKSTAQLAGRKRARNFYFDAEPMTPSKRFCYSSKSLLDLICLKEFKQFYIKINLKQWNGYNNSNVSGDGEGDDDNDDDDDDYINENANYVEADESRFNFDLYLNRNKFKKSSPEPPPMRVLVISSTEKFPNHTEICELFYNLYHRTPILIVSVGESKQIQGFIYFFT